jgi:hypothetical protein
MVEVVKWQTDTDQFEHGQWFYGRIYAEGCGLSPNGSLFVYFTMKHGRVDTANGYKQKFTAVSRPAFQCRYQAAGYLAAVGEELVRMQSARPFEYWGGCNCLEALFDLGAVREIARRRS